jgi:phytoene desaturase
MKKGPSVVVIGAGFGGLAAAIRLQARGFQVTLVEKRDQPGGRAYVYRDAGFAFDGGPTVVTAPFLLEELFALAGQRMEDSLQLVPVDPFYRVRFHDGRVFDYNGDAEHMAAEVAKFNPADVDGYQRFVEESRKIFTVGFEKLGDVPFGSWTSMAKIVPSMMRLRSHLSVWSLVSKYIKDPDLRIVMSFHPLLVGGNPFTTTSIYSLIAYLERKWGVWFALGGTGAIVEALAALFRKLGGVLECGSEVERIVVKNGRVDGVQIKHGPLIPARIVVSNGDAPFTYKHLLDAAVRKKYTDARIDKMRYSMSLVVAYFGTKKTYPDLAHHTILLGPRYREKLFEHLEQTCIPGLRENLVTDHMITPQHFQDELNSLNGAAFSIQPVLTQSAYFRFHNRSEDVEGLYFVGAGTHPGAGLPGVLSSAKVVDRLIPDVDGTGNQRDPIAGTHAL